MLLIMKSLFLVFALIGAALGRQGFGPTEQEWGYVTVRPGAHMFWWLQQTAADVASYTDVPVLVWLQGGPGSSGTGYGNFAELGPLDENLNPRNTTWLNYANVLFVDNPVGTGFSYTSSYDELATTNRQIAEDFLALIQGFYEAVPDLVNTPLYIFCESYGGKMTAEIALVLDQAIKNGVLDINFVGVGLGDGWLSPIDSVLTWGPYLLNLGIVDQNGYEQIQDVAEQTRQAVESEDWLEATNLWGLAESVVMYTSEGVDFYNVLTKIPGGFKKPFKLWKPSIRDEVDDKIDVIMNNQVKEALGLDVTWGAQGGMVFDALGEDFMKPATEIVELLLNTTTLKVAVYNGELDLIVDTPGTIAWVDKLQFDGSDEWKTATRNPMGVDGIVEGYVKKVGNLAMYWVLRSGHMVPADNPAGMWYIMNDVTESFS